MAGAPRPHYLTCAAGQIRIWQAGQGSDLVVVPGLTLAASVVAADLAGRHPGHRITAIELPGLGGSADHGAASLPDLAETVREAMRLAGTGSARPVLCDLAGALRTYLDGDPVWVAAERAVGWTAARIAPPDGAPRTDGTHLTALWTFLRDRHVLRPDDPTQPDPDGEPVPDADSLDATLTSFAVRPDRYAALWRVLSAGIGAAPAGEHVRSLADLLASPSARPDAAAPARTQPLPGARIWHQEVETARGRTHLRRAGGEGRPLLVIPTGGGSSSQFAPVVQGLARGRQVFSVDYLGNGLSEKPDRQNVTIADLAEDMAALVDALGFAAVDVWGSHTGAVVGLELALRHPDKVGRLVMEGPVFVSPDFQTDLLSSYFPPLRPDGWGRHLQSVWNWRRDMFLFWPWYRAERGATRQLGLPSPQHLHDYAIGILESGPTYDSAYRAAFSYDTASRLPRLTRPALVTAGPNDMLANALAETQALALPNVEVRETPTTVWWPDPEPDAAATTLAIYDAFLTG